MNLAKWLQVEGLSMSEFSRRTGVPVSNLWRIVTRPDRTITASLALHIIESTGGAVTLSDLAPVPYKRRRVKRSNGRAAGAAA